MYLLHFLDDSILSDGSGKEKPRFCSERVNLEDSAPAGPAGALQGHLVFVLGAGARCSLAGEGSSKPCLAQQRSQAPWMAFWPAGGW